MAKRIDAAFRNWLEQLDAAAAREDKKCRGLPLSTQTGAEAWRWYFDEGYTVADALIEYSSSTNG